MSINNNNKWMDGLKTEIEEMNGKCSEVEASYDGLQKVNKKERK